MKILHILQTINLKNGGGVTARNLKLIKYLEKNRTENYLISTFNKHDCYKFSIIQPNRTLFLKLINIGKFPIPIPNLRSFNNLVKKADIIHLTNFWTLLNLYAYIFCVINNKKYVICPAGALKIMGDSKLFKLFYKILFGDFIINNASSLIAITDREKREFEKYGVPSKKISVIPNGIECAEKNFSDKNIEDEFKKFRPYILFIGRLNYIKGPDLLLKAFIKIAKDFPEYKLLFAGPDEGMKINLDSMIKKSKLENKVLFLGFVNELRKRSLYQNASILVIPSRSEAMSLVVLEAALNGLSSIFTNVCGLESLAKNKNFYSVEVDEYKIAEALREFLCNKQKNKYYKNKKIREYVRKNFNWDLIAKKYIDILYCHCNLH